MIGPKGPIVVEPEGSTDGTPEGVLVRSGDGPPEGGLRVQLHSLYSNSLPTNGHSHQACDVWPVTGSHFWSTILLPTSGHDHQACDWFTLLVNKLPPNKRVPATTASASRINLRSGFTEKFAETGLLVSAKEVSMAWFGLA